MPDTDKKSLPSRLRANYFPFSPTTYATAVALGGVIGLKLLTREHRQAINLMRQTINELIESQNQVLETLYVK